METIEELQRKIAEMTRSAPGATSAALPAPASAMAPVAPAAPIAPVYPPPGYPPAPGYPGYPPPPPAVPQALGFSVPVSVRTPGGEVTVSVQFGPEWAASPQAAEQLLGMLIAAGWPVKAWQPKQNGGGGGGGWGGGGRGRY